MALRDRIVARCSCFTQIWCRLMSGSDQDALPDYVSIAATLQRCGLRQSPAELQGFALGIRIGGVPEPLSVWQQELYSDFDADDVLAGEGQAMLDRLFADVLVCMDEQTWGLTLLLPQDIVVDAARLSAVRDWCQGFLYGFGLGGETPTAKLSEQARELLHDFTEFTRLDTEAAEDDIENQSALIEIEEYLRVGVMLIRDELNAVDRV